MNSAELLHSMTHSMTNWFREAKYNCVPGRCWWDNKKNKPDADGYFCVVGYNKRTNEWKVEDHGIYEHNKKYGSRKQLYHLFVVKDLYLDLTEEQFATKIKEQFKSLQVKFKLDDIEKDF